MTAEFNKKNRPFDGCYFTPVFRFILVIFFFLTVSGCVPVKVPEKVNSETNDLEAGETAFFQKDYTAAHTRFSFMIKKSEDAEVRNIALYNLACTKLMTSGNEQDFSEAMGLLNNWKPSKKGRLHSENPLLMFQAFQKIANSKKKARLENLKKGQAMNTIVKHQNKKIMQLKQMIKTLQHQILELEHIDQEIQERRKTN